MMCKFTPVKIIADYMLRFLKNNADAKLYEAMQRLEKKLVSLSLMGLMNINYALH
ncbi:hypothetical protein ACJP8O_004959 [Enterobacter hormaechei]